MPKSGHAFTVLCEDGLCDWEILSIIGSIALNARASFSPSEDPASMIARAQAMYDIVETEQSALPPALFTSEQFEIHRAVFLAAHLRSWGLLVPSHCEHSDLEKFMAVRYRMRLDDTDHTDLFGWSESIV